LVREQPPELHDPRMHGADIEEIRSLAPIVGVVGLNRRDADAGGSQEVIVQGRPERVEGRVPAVVEHHTGHARTAGDEPLRC
jgi:hypothetical protein